MEENSNASSVASDGQTTPTTMSSPPSFANMTSTTTPVGKYSNGNGEEEKNTTTTQGAGSGGTGGGGGGTPTSTEVVCS